MKSGHVQTCVEVSDSVDKWYHVHFITDVNLLMSYAMHLRQVNLLMSYAMHLRQVCLVSVFTALRVFLRRASHMAVIMVVCCEVYTMG